MGDEATGTPDGIDGARVEAWFAENVPGAEPPLSFERIAGGHSNLTYRATDANGRHWALRRPPLGKRLGSAHDMAPRAPRRLGARRDPGAGGAGRRPLRGRERQRRALLRDGVRRGPDPARPRRGRDLSRPSRPAGDRRARRRHPGRDPRRRPRRRRARRARQEGGLRRPPAAPLAGAVGEVEDPRAADHRRGPRAAGGGDPRAGPGDDRPRRLPPRQHDPHPRRARSPRSSTGSSARSATRSPTSAC